MNPHSRVVRPLNVFACVKQSMNYRGGTFSLEGCQNCDKQFLGAVEVFLAVMAGALSARFLVVVCDINTLHSYQLLR